MRVVNMAHGAFYLLGGYVAYEVQQRMTGSGFALQSVEVSTLEWVVPWLVAMVCIGVFGLGVQQLLLRWNQGQDLRQALITIAVSVIVADQVIAHFPRTVPAGTQRFGGNAVSLTWPGWTNQFVDLHVAGVSYSLARLVMLALGVGVGIVLWLWLHRTKTGMVIRAGVDDRQMTSALGINIQVTFAIAFLVGSALAAFGAVVGGSQSSIAQGQDGAVAPVLPRRRDHRRHGLARGRRGGLAPVRARLLVRGRLPPDDGRQLLHAVLGRAHLRAHGARARLPAAGALREGGVTLGTPKTITERVIGVGALVARGPRAAPLQRLLAELDPHPGTDPRDRRREPHLPLGLRRDDLARPDRPDGHRRLRAREHGHPARPGGETKGLLLGWDPTLALIAAILLTTAVGLVFGAVASRSFGIYFLMLTLTYTVIAFLFVGSVTLIGGFSPVAGVDQYTPGFIGDIVNDRQRLYFIALDLGRRVYLAHPLPRSALRSGSRSRASATSRCAWPRSATTSRSTGRSPSASERWIAALGGVLYAWWFGQLSPTIMGLDATIQLLVIAVIGGLRRIEGAWLGAVAFLVINNEVTNRIPAVGAARDRRDASTPSSGSSSSRS